MDAYLLLIRWLKVEYDIDDDKVIKLLGTYFSGPVLKHAAKIQPNDNIRLDFTEQYTGKIQDYYIAKFSWGDVKYQGDIVYLGDCLLECKYKDILPKLKDDDYIVVNTVMHEEAVHQYFMNYTAELYSAFGEAYAFRSM